MEDTATSAPTTREIPIEFKATGGEYFRIWIVNLLLTIVTLGIYSAWAKVRRMRYFYGNTFLDGTSFEYHGKPIAILKGRLIALAAYLVFVTTSRISPVITGVLIIPMMLMVPWIIVRARLFQMRMTSWRGLRFNFHGTYSGALATYVGWMLLAIVTLFILWPLALWKQVKFIVTNTAYGTQRFGFVGTKRRFYAFCALTVLQFLGLLIVLAMVVAGMTALHGKGSAALSPNQNPLEAIKYLFSSGMAMAGLVYVTALTLITAYFRVSMLNAAIGNIQIGPHRVYSRLRAMGLANILITNLLAMMVTLGLFYPWAKVRSLRYQLANTGVVANGDLGQFATAGGVGASAVGEEVGEFFDIDFGF